MTDADVLIVGGGIAGLSAAWFAAKQGRSVTLVDEGVHRASDLPIALVNPLRGHQGRLIAAGVAGMHATFALIDALRADGHAIDSARGLFRPLIDRRGAAHDERYWRSTIGAALPFDWYPRAPASLGLVDPVPTLRLRDAGWVAPAGLLAALRCAVATAVTGRVVDVDPVDGIMLADATRLRARTVLWCGGAWGASLLDAASNDASSDGFYRPGSLSTAAATLTEETLSFGLYAVPYAGSTWVGPTREDGLATFPHAPVADAAVRHLADRVARTFGTKIVLRPVWRGVRLARLSTAANDALHGTSTLTALGSRGFLIAPLLAADWARSL